MTDMQKRYGIIGAGMMGREHMRNIALLDGARVTAIAEPDTEQTGLSMDLLGAGARAYPTHREMLAAEALDAVVVAAPNHLHLPILRDLLRTELPVLCEKPLGVSDAECAEIETLQARRAAPLWVAMEYRYMPAVARLLAEVRAGTAGRVRMLTIREHRFPFLTKVGNWNRFRAQSGGTLVEKCCHFFDLMRLILDAEPVRVFASGGMDVNFLDEEYAGRRADVLDNAYVVVDFDGGQRAMLDLCMFAEGAEWQEEISATGDRARLDARVPGPARFAPGGVERHGEFVLSDRATRRVTREVLETDPRILRAGDHHGSTFFQHQAFLAMVNGGSGPAVSVEDGRIAVAVGAAAEESARSGQPVELSRQSKQALRA
ncbi:gfo/Idh/MocA family oxidoreductase [Rhodobacteraceae bacterium 2CG4]|uniref:Gfo/Idh/MocA family oxidoreductase n=1 Tax=Halovulum marinum TaxID=2662447 RepID=A0A6L5Z1Y1_9RHOB|nr:Gfo/Idh/MocA family oxidoreductase [Halovulum marinum]MSU90573.1 gfo/Idh/MocA family oxidoreductase [Halovulum marinum]